jgi:hypothetical protein
MEVNLQRWSSIRLFSLFAHSQRRIRLIAVLIKSVDVAKVSYRNNKASFSK